MSQPTIADFSSEDRLFPSPPAFQAEALVADESLYREADADVEAFWARQARELLTWSSDFHTTLEWQLPDARWFLGGTLNVSENCLDRHVAAGRGDKVAFHWEGEPGDTRTITYAELLDEVSRFANVLKGLGVERGDRVAIYMPMVPELPVALLACTRIGAAHSVIFGGFSPDSIVDRVNDGGCKVVVTADGGYRRGAASPLKPNVDEAVESCPTVTGVVVVRRTGGDVTMAEGRDHWYHELMADAAAVCPPEQMDSEDLLFLLYTSGTTAKPKGIMHTTGGYLTQVAFTHKYVFDLKPDTDVYWCSADIGWITGHSYIVYGPLANGATSVLYEGTPDTPGKDRLWDIVERYGVTQLYTAPTAIRMFMKWGAEEPEKHDLSSLRLLGTVGEPINPEAWIWYHTHIGGGGCPIVDTWWQTETGGHMITPLPGVTALKPGSATLPLPGIGVEVVDDAGNPIERGGGYLTLTRPWPAMLRGIWGDPQRYFDTYWSTYPGRYFAGDGARIDDDGYLWLLGRVDDVMNISGHRISTTEVESALVDHPAVAEAAVVGASDDITGQAIVGYVIVRNTAVPSDELVEEIRQHVAHKIGPTARPKRVIIVPDLPKTRSGKIMRRLLRDVAEGRDLGDTTTLADPSVVDAIRSSAAEGPGEWPVTQVWVPDNWRWRAGSVEAGPAVVFDMDGVLSDASRRQHYLDRPFRDWEAFFQACGDDDLIAEVGRLLEVLDPELKVLLLTARPQRVRDQTLAWLQRYGLRWDLLVMRDWDDFGSSRSYKQRVVGEFREYGFELRLAFEDDRRNVDMFHAEGVPCVYIHSGYYD